MLLDGKVAIVTGSGRGIGAATAKLFAEHGARVIVSDLDADPAHESAESIKAIGATAIAVPGDVTDPNFPHELMKAAIDEFGTLDIMVNNAGFTWDGMVHKIGDKQWDKVIEVHLTAPFRMIRAAANTMRAFAKDEMASGGAAPSRKIVNVSSTSGTYGNVGQANYAAAKAGIIGLTKTVAKEWGRFNICCNAVAFGWIDTRMTGDKAKGETIEIDGQEIAIGIPYVGIEERKQIIPLGRSGTPQEAAGPVLFLASPLSDYVTGEVVMVTGGR